MPEFNRYASYYDTLYADKDYPVECDYLEAILRFFSPHPVKTVLDLGCGTGGHATLLSQRGYQVLGVDRSSEMLAVAREKTGSLAGPEITFLQGDLRNLELGRTFDAVIAMFAVMGYQTTNHDLVNALQSVRRHLKPGGIFTFDAWYGPAVITQRPVDRYKQVENPGERLIRFARPSLDLITHVVEVNYKVIRIQDGQVVDEVDETHAMRFFFIQELVYYLDTCGFEALQFCPFLELGKELTEQDWNFSVIARAR